MNHKSPMPAMTTAFYYTKSYDRDHFGRAEGSRRIAWQFHEIRLNAESAETARGAQAVCVFVHDQLDRGCLESLAGNGVRLIALRCAGFNNVDLEVARQLGLNVVRVPSYSPHSVAEHAVALLLSLNRRIPQAYNRVRTQNFSLSGLVGFDIAGKCVGIVGTGRIGRVTAQIFRGFDARVLACDPMPSPDWALAHGIRYTGFDSLLEQSDILSLHLPLTPRTQHLLDGRSMARMNPGAYLVNTSRGKLVDTTALIAALKSGPPRRRGAGRLRGRGGHFLRGSFR